MRTQCPRHAPEHIGAVGNPDRVPTSLHTLKPIPWAAYTSRRLCREVCALANGRTADTPPDGASGEIAKNTKIVETNSTKSFRINKTSKKRTQNEPRTNCKRRGNPHSGTPILAKRSQLTSVSSPEPVADGARHIGSSAKDVKIVETNSTKLFGINKTAKKRTQNELKTNSKTSPKTRKRAALWPYPGRGEKKT